MLSYQHAYHAGNPADVHKHIALVLLLRHLQRKDAPLAYLDSHAGRGVYDLEGEAARKTREAETGILRLAEKSNHPVEGRPPPDAVRDYLELVDRLNAPDRTRIYPGSAALAKSVLREQDRAILLELHPQELAALRIAVAGDRRISVHARDCYEGLPALLPPPAPRGLALLDPSYEVRDEYERIVALLGRSLARWAHGVYLLWYPLLPEGLDRRLLGRLTALSPPKTLISEYRFSSAAVGLQGSGLVIVNTPWHLDESLEDAMRYVAVALDESGRARYEQRWLGSTAPA